METKTYRMTDTTINRFKRVIPPYKNETIGTYLDRVSKLLQIYRNSFKHIGL